MRNSLIIRLAVLLALFGSAAFGQGSKRLTSNEWVTLSKVTYKASKDAYGDINVPVFSADVKAMSGKVVTLPGYIIPLDGIEGAFKADHFVLSSLPVEACFFCGVGGPETVAEVQMKSPVEYTKKPVRLKGKLTLNADDPYRMIYILEDAEFVGTAQ
ncbi:MAG: DUF3299 domain-containing protein [Cytophagales bacterium]|jgi:hypothetical protein|nr:DUF3299 domain-containing protein [Cytophagales bacterium]